MAFTPGGGGTGLHASAGDSAAPGGAASLWRTIFENAAVGMALMDFRTRFVDTNPAFRRLVGYSSTELCTRSFLDLTHEDDRSRALELTAQLLAGQHYAAQAERRCLRQDGQVIWVRTSESLIPGASGLPEFILSVVEDITDRKGAEEELRRSEAYLSEGQRLSHTGSWVLDLSTGVFFWSDEMFRIYEVDPAGGAPTYRWLLDSLHPTDAHEVDRSVQRALLDHNDFEGEYRLLLPRGAVKYIHYVAHPVVSRAGEVVEMIGTVMDLTDQKRTEAQLNASLGRARALATRLMQAQDEERRRIARDLHETTAQDLAALKMNLAAIARRAFRLGESDKAALAESTRLAEQAMSDIRTLSYLLHPPFLDEVGLASALRWYVEGFAERSGIRVELRLPPRLGRLPREIETTLFRVVQESLSNIHRHAGSPSALIELECGPDRLVLAIRDEGRGIGEGAGRERAIEEGALGVGIAGMRERVKQLGGRLEIESTSRGTTVRAVLPACDEEP